MVQLVSSLFQGISSVRWPTSKTKLLDKNLREPRLV